MNLKRYITAWTFRCLSVTGLASIAVVFGLGLLLVGCGSGSTVTGTSQVQVFNAYLPPAGTDGSVTITVNGSSTMIATNTPFGQFANGGVFSSVPSGKLTASAQPTGITGTFGFQHNPTLIPGNYYTIAAAGQAGQTGTLIPRLITIPHSSKSLAPIPTGDVAVRIVNLSLNPNPVSLYTSSSGTLAPVNSVVSNIPYGYNSQTNGYVYLPVATPSNLALVDAGTQNVLTLSASSNLATNTFTAGQAYTLFVYGQPGSSSQPLGATWVADQASP